MMHVEDFHLMHLLKSPYFNYYNIDTNPYGLRNAQAI